LFTDSLAGFAQQSLLLADFRDVELLFESRQNALGSIVIEEQA
jgi:hypothetical protein